MQENAVNEYILHTHPDWQMTREFRERGVSGWTTKIDERESLNEILDGAKKKEFDVLIVFMLDRLCRRMLDAPKLIKELIRAGVEVWSVKEGQQFANSAMDNLKNTISFYSAENESEKTSIRVREIFEQLNEEGAFLGGTAPYGYEIYPTGRIHHKHKRVIHDIRIDEDEATLVRLMYDCALTKGWGVVRIANYLNDEGYTTRSQGNWTFSHIARILRNSIYMGRPRYNIYDKESKREKKSILLPREEWKLQKQNPKLIIVDDTKWQQVQEIMDARTRNKNRQSRSLPQKGKLLLNGIARCGYCGSVLKCSYSVKNYQKKSGETTKHMSYRYDCPNGRSHKSSHPIHMFGKKYELSAEEQIIRYIQTADLDSFYQDML